MPLRKNGFTLIEILTVTAVTAILIILGSVSYIYFARKTDLDKTAYDILTAIQTAQTKTLASEDSSAYGMRFETDKYTLFKVDAHYPGDPNNKTYSLPKRLEIYDISLAGGGDETVFQKISGETNQSGTIGLRVISDPARTKTISISPMGRSEINPSGVQCCDTNRVTDTRHINLTLGWSIQGATTLTLNFPDTPEVNVDILMADYFDSGQTEFDWSNSINVNGQNQELTIHTVLLNGANTILSVHRDQDNNNKPLEISIDNKDIISYTANGDATIGSFGGTAEIQ